MIGKQKWPQSVSVWVSIVSAVWLMVLLFTVSSWSTSFSLQTSDRKKKVHLRKKKSKLSDLLYTLELFKRKKKKKAWFGAFVQRSAWQQRLPGPFGEIKMFWQPLADKNSFTRGDLSPAMACLRRRGGVHGRTIGCDPCKRPSRLKLCSWN